MASMFSEWTKEEVRSVIRFLWAKQVPATEIHRELLHVYGESVMTIQHVRKWCREFESGRVTVTDDHRSGRPSISDEHVQDIEAAVQADRRISISHLETRFELSRGTIWNIVHERLGFRKICSRWVPRQLTEEHKKTRMGLSLEHLQRYERYGDSFISRIVTGDETWVHNYTPESKAESMTWKHPGSPPVQKFKTAQSVGKVMATVFWDIHGLLLLDFAPAGSTINATAYQKSLKKLKAAIRRKRPELLTEGVILHHDNARPHTAVATVHLLTSWGWEILPHPPYSPDLAPCDFHLFPKMKKHLRNQRFECTADAQIEAKNWLRSQDASFFYEGLDKLIYRYDKCLNKLGEYVEK
jgi:histone-lysine N-methyltransferase SETMAR